MEKASLPAEIGAEAVAVGLGVLDMADKPGSRGMGVYPLVA